MKKSKGFAVTTVIYSILILLSLFMFLILGTLRSTYSNQKEFVDNLRQELNNNLNKVPENPKINLARNWKEKTTNEINYRAIYTLNSNTLPSTYTYNGTTYNLTTTIDVSEQGNNAVLLGEYTSGSNIIAVFAQEGGIVAPVDSSFLFALTYVNYNEGSSLGYVSKLTSIDLSNFDTSYVRNMHDMFARCQNLTSLDVSKFDTSRVIDMTGIFYNCNRLTSLDVSNFDTSNVIIMEGMFFSCNGLKELDLTSFDTSKVTTMYRLFQGCSSLTKITVGCNWQEASITTDMFYSARISSVTKVCNEEIKKDNSSLLVSNLAKNWKDKTTSETSYLALYTYNSKDLPTTYTYNGTAYTLNKTIDVSEQGDSLVLLGEYKNGSNTIALIGQDGGVVSPVDSSWLFSGLTKLSVIDLSNLDTSNTTNMAMMFNNCNKLISIDLSSLNTEKANTIQGMFQNCKLLSNVNLSGLNTTNVLDMSYMFQSCSNIQTIDLTSFDTKNTETMFSMFGDCTKLTKVTVGCNWKNAPVLGSMFSNAGTSEVTKEC